MTRRRTVLYAAQGILQNDAEIGKKDHVWPETPT
jgi:hypothetical protein